MGNVIVYKELFGQNKIKNVVKLYLNIVNELEEKFVESVKKTIFYPMI